MQRSQKSGRSKEKMSKDVITSQKSELTLGKVSSDR